MKVHMSTIHIDGMPPGCSTEQCAERKTRNCRMFTEEIRRQIFENFWAIQDREKRKIFLLENIESINVLRRRTKNYSMRNFTNNYFLPIGDRRLQVCKYMFVATFNIGAKTVNEWITNRNAEPSA